MVRTDTEKGSNWREELRRLTNGRVLLDEPMSRHTSIGLGGRADALLFPAAIGELAPLAVFFRSRGIPFLPVGNGTNLIVRDGGYRGALICLADLKAIRIRDEKEGRVAVTAEAGAGLPEMIRWMIQESLSGMEFCAGIPGSIGGAVRMNAGAYGGAMQEVVEKISVVNGSGRLREVGKKDLLFEYRRLDLPEEALIAQVDLSLLRGEREQIRSRIAEITETRRKKHPLGYPSAGSVFKNPPGQPAGSLVDRAGLKGSAVGGARVSDVHGNFIINAGGATARDFLTLMQLVQEKVLEKTGVALEPEVKVVGEP